MARRLEFLVVKSEENWLRDLEEVKLESMNRSMGRIDRAALKTNMNIAILFILQETDPVSGRFSLEIEA